MTRPPAPIPDTLTQPFWDAARQGRLVVQRCQNCSTYYHPPRPYCVRCECTDLGFEDVSGRGRVYSYTETVTGARHPYFAENGPYLVGMVELDEQDGLFLITNFPGARLSDLHIGAPVKVAFDAGAPVLLPQFQLVDAEEREAHS